jgi:hypothetical protein
MTRQDEPELVGDSTWGLEHTTGKYIAQGKRASGRSSQRRHAVLVLDNWTRYVIHEEGTRL